MAKYSIYVNTETLRRERYAKNITMNEMAKLLGKKSLSSYSNIENGIVEPKISEIIKISNILNNSPNIFFNFDVQESCTCSA